MDERCVKVITELVTSLFLTDFKIQILHEWLRFSSKAELGCIPVFTHLLETILTNRISLSIRPDHIEFFADDSTLRITHTDDSPLRIPRTALNDEQKSILQFIEVCWHKFFAQKKQSFDPSADSLEECYYDDVIRNIIDRRILIIGVLTITISESVRYWDGLAFKDVYEIVYASMKNLFTKKWVLENENMHKFVIKTIKLFKEQSHLLHNSMTQEHRKRLDCF